MNMSWKALPTLFIQAALITTAAVLAVVLVTRYVAPIPFSITQTTTQKDTAFLASGKSVMTTVPDKAEVTVGISKRESDIKRAQSSANDTMKNITDELVKIGVNRDDIKTQNYSIYPNYDYQNGGQRILGYAVDVSMTISVKDFELMNKVVDTATALGANQVSGVNFTISDELERTVRQEARQKAIDDAKANAQELARLSGVKLGRVLNVSEGNTSPSYPIPMMERSAIGAGGGGAPTDIKPGSTNYTYTVTLSYETL